MGRLILLGKVVRGARIGVGALKGANKVPALTIFFCLQIPILRAKNVPVKRPFLLSLLLK